MIFVQISALPSEMSYHNAVNFIQAVILPVVSISSVSVMLGLINSVNVVTGTGSETEAECFKGNGVSSLWSVHLLPRPHASRLHSTTSPAAVIW